MKERFTWLQQWRRVFARHQAMPQKCNEQVIQGAVNAKLDPELAALVRYFIAIEGINPMIAWYLRWTPSAFSGCVREFINKWDIEEVNHARALYAACGEGVLTHQETHQRALLLARPDLKNRSYLTIFYSYVLGIFFPPVHMMFGAISEATTRFAYMRLGEVTDCPVFRDVVARIRADESAHMMTYYNAAELLCKWGWVRKIVDLLARYNYSPVGSKMMPEGEPNKVVRALLVGQEERFAKEFNARFSKMLSQQTIDAIVARTFALA